MQYLSLSSSNTSILIFKDIQNTTQPALGPSSSNKPFKMYTKSLLTATLAGLAAAVPVIQRAEDSSFNIIAIHSGTNVQNQAINANGQRFWIGKPTSTYCPETISCPSNTDVTAFAYNAAGAGLSMDDVVPGGQQVYVAADGQLGFTIAHSASIPEGASVSGFVYTSQTESGAPGELTWNSFSFSACPNGDEGVYQIYADNATIANSPDSTCINIAAATLNNTVGAAWQYA